MKKKSLISLFLTFLFIINFFVLSVNATAPNTGYATGSSSGYAVDPLSTILGISYFLVIVGVPILILVRVILIITRSKGNDEQINNYSLIDSNSYMKIPDQRDQNKKKGIRKNESSSCGSKILSNDTFCENCGKEL